MTILIEIQNWDLMSKKEAVTIMEIYFSLLWQESGLIIILIWAICCVHKIKNARHVARYEFPIGVTILNLLA